MQADTCAVLAFALLAPVVAGAQGITPSRDEVTALTSEWKGERFPDGRPKVPDAILHHMANVRAQAPRSRQGDERQRPRRWPRRRPQFLADRPAAEARRLRGERVLQLRGRPDDKLPVPREQIQELLKERTW